MGREWVLDEIEDWMRGNQRFLLLVAEPGWGKTAIAEWLTGDDPAPPRVEALRARIDASHFCVGRGQDGKADPAQFAKDLAEQLLRKDAGTAWAWLEELAPETRIVQNVGRNEGQVIALQSLTVNQINPSDVYHRAVRRPLQRLGSGVTRTILVDALDEAPSIAKLVAGSGDFPAGVRFILTTRDVKSVVDDFRRDGRIVALSTAEYAGRTDADLGDYIATRVTDPVVAADLVRRAEGNFLYAFWVLAELDQGDVTDVGALPSGLNGLYRTFLDRIVPPGDAWPRRHEPFLGCLTVATPVAPTGLLPGWLGWSWADFSVHREDVSQVIEDVRKPPEGEPGYRLYHRSVADFLAAREYEEDGSTRDNKYYVDPLPQHERIVAYYLDRPGWADADDYCLRRLVHHLAARARISGRAGDLYRVVLDEGFRFAQQERLGIHQSLTDLRETADLALGRGDLLPALRCVAAYRGIAAAESLSVAVFDAVGAGDIPRARLKMTHYTAGPNGAAAWNETLKLYLAWEAAESGDAADAHELVASTASRFPDLGDALSQRIREALGEEADPGERAAFDADRRGIAPELPAETVRQAVARLEREIERLERHTDAKSVPAASAYSFVTEPDAELMDPETSSLVARELGGSLGRLAAHDAGQRLIERTLRAVYRNPYPRYRDIALRQTGQAVLRSPDRLWVRRQLQGVLRAGLDDEGITFTFDLATLLVAEGDRRGIDFKSLRAYAEQAAAQDDVWGTRMRAAGAAAAAAFRTGEPDRAFELLFDASRARATYAGYGALGVLSLIGRCHEFGRPELAAESVWGPERDRTLPDMAESFAAGVYDSEFRDERLELVSEHRTWCAEPPPTPAEALDRHSRMVALDIRAAYRDLVSARWAGAGPAAAREVAKLVPLALADTTNLDALLARLVAVNLPRRTDEDLAALAELTDRAFSTGRPWNFGQWR